ncbi:hypothetical protein CYMTET_7572 [Cymbomonas tetramitiformis]|uniref:Uncharacterized protein n=1 Tax=Cymbomonas tetramitiformis TaxID=36881 RepID=A0AAE0LHB6_9CHLO|nr:hypothetical protein CYMTET_7572 [Cymbomonas tetramitiformis]
MSRHSTQAREDIPTPTETDNELEDDCTQSGAEQTCVGIGRSTHFNMENTDTSSARGSRLSAVATRPGTMFNNVLEDSAIKQALLENPEVRRFMAGYPSAGPLRNGRDSNAGPSQGTLLAEEEEQSILPKIAGAVVVAVTGVAVFALSVSRLTRRREGH